MMGLPPGPEEARLARLSPEGLQRATFAAVRAVVARLMERGPTVLALEDLHWADPTSLRLTEELAALAADGPLLVLATRRPEPDPGVSDLESSLAADAQCPLRTVELSPFARGGRAGLGPVAHRPGRRRSGHRGHVRGRRGQPAVLGGTALLTGRDGRPGQGRDGLAPQRHRRHGGPRGVGAPHPLPGGPARPEAREVIISASVLGREFGLSFLAAVAEVEGGLGSGLAELCATGLLTEVRQGPEPAYRFRHALIQEAIYGGMVRSQRRQLHARAAWGLEAASAERLEEVAAVLGYHYAAAGGNRAGGPLLRAGRLTTPCRSFANEEAITSFRAGIEVADLEGPVSEDMAQAAIVLRAKLAQVFWRTGRTGEAREVLGEAVRLVGQGDALQRVPCPDPIGKGGDRRI